MEEYIENERFNAAKEKIIGKKHNDKGIGTLSEKTVHGVLKHFFEPDEDCHEVALHGYFADIYNDSGVIEIQTRQLNKLREKLAVFLNYYPVTVVYPMPANKWLSWINPETGETGGRRKSPRHFTIYDSFFELYKIKSYLKNPNLTIKLVLMDVEEYKLLNGWDNSLDFRKIFKCINRLIVRDCHIFGSTDIMQVCMLRSDTRIVKTCGD